MNYFNNMTFKTHYNSYLVESRKSRYRDFFQDLLKVTTRQPNYSIETTVDGIIDKAIVRLGREDRIMWYLRYIKNIMYIGDTVTKALNKGVESEENIPLPDYVTHYFYKTANITIKELPLSSLRAILYMDVSREQDITDTLQHFLSLPIPEIINYKFENQKLKVILNHFKALEELWRENGGEREINITDDLRNGTIVQILSYNGGKEGWFNLKKASCREEGRSMGHCGNSPRSNTNDTILSFRSIKKHKGITLAIPHLTFILTDKGKLTESKGRGNNKPIAKYHPYIIDLLLLKDPSSYLIKEIVGGGYMAQNNFCVADLSKENREILLKERPELK